MTVAEELVGEDLNQTNFIWWGITCNYWRYTYTRTFNVWPHATVVPCCVRSTSGWWCALLCVVDLRILLCEVDLAPWDRPNSNRPMTPPIFDALLVITYTFWRWNEKCLSAYDMIRDWANLKILFYARCFVNKNLCFPHYVLITLFPLCAITE